VRLADFSTLATPGSYRIAVEGLADSAPFPIAADAYRALDAGAIRAYTLNRAGIALDREVAGAWARPAGHPDDKVLVHASAASAARPAGTVIASPKGWYDAGDYNKYIVNSGISTWTLLAAYEHFPAWFDGLALRLPEGNNGLPDLVTETLWNLDWMATMQDPQDGGVYHKLTNLRFDAMVMPDQASKPRYVVQKTTAAALDFAATMAAASRVLARFDTAVAGPLGALAGAGGSGVALGRQESRRCCTASRPTSSPAPMATRRSTTNSPGPRPNCWPPPARPGTASRPWPPGSARATEPGWGDVRMLGWITLAGQAGNSRPTPPLPAATSSPMPTPCWRAGRPRPTAWPWAGKDFVWGSNAVALNQAMMLIQAYRLTQRRDYLDAAQSALDYTLGRNPLGTSFVTGFGTVSPQHPHHRPSVADGVAAPVPGWLVGGPNPGGRMRQGCKAAYASRCRRWRGWMMRAAMPAMRWRSTGMRRWCMWRGPCRRCSVSAGFAPGAQASGI
jgi:endoglucanase